MLIRHTRANSLLLLLEGVELLGLESSGLAEVEGDVVGSQLLVGVGNGFKAGLDVVLVKGIKEDLFAALAFNGDFDLATSNT